MNIEVKIIEIITEDATANASNTAGMGGIVASQPSILPGVTIGSNAGTVGSGDIGVSYSGYPFQKAAAGKKPSKKLFSLKQDYTQKPHKAGSKKKRRIRKFSNFAKK